MPFDKPWDGLTEADWEAFARAWLETFRSTSQACADDGDFEEWDVGQSVAMMNFTARAEHQWRFILKAVALADSDEALGHIAAGPLEHLLGWHGETFIAEIERQAVTDPKFARTLTGVWQYKMSDSLWARVQALQARVPDPLPSDGDT